MKNLLTIVILFLTASSWADTICPEYKSNREPEFSWKESDFTEKAAKESLKFLEGVLLHGKSYEWISLPNAQIVISGFLHKREALKAIHENNAAKEYYVSKFCTFLQNSVRYD